MSVFIFINILSFDGVVNVKLEQFLPNKMLNENRAKKVNEQNVFKIKNSTNKAYCCEQKKRRQTQENTFRVQLMRGNSSDSKGYKKRGNRVLNFKLAFLLSVKRLFPQELMAQNVKVFPSLQ